MSLESNLLQVNERIEKAARSSGRSAKEICLVAVSKTHPMPLIEEAYRLGQKTFGENYVQEAIEKVAALPSANWHFIGSLQTNKVKQVVGKFALIHSVDRIKLAREIDKVAVNQGVIQDILLQIHVGDEETKSGASIEEAPQLIEEIAKMKGVRLKGIMSMPPLTDSESVARGYFSSLKKAFESWQSIAGKDFTELSMGTSSDFEWAVLEGATMVRIGTTIFGKRDYAN